MANLYVELGKKLEALGVKMQEQTDETKETEKKEVKFMVEGTLESGAKIMSPADEWAVGVEVFVVTDEGDNVPLPEGSYPLEGGGTLVVEQEGVVGQLDLGGGSEEEEAEKTEQSSEETPEAKEPKSITESIVKELKFRDEKIEGLEKQLTVLSKAFNEFKEKSIKDAEDKFKVAGEGIAEVALALDELAKPVTSKKAHNPEGKESAKKITLSSEEERLLTANPSTLSTAELAKRTRLQYSNFKIKK